MSQEREALEEQMRELQEKAMARPMPQDPLGMIAFMSVLLIGAMQANVLQADFEEKKGVGDGQQ